ncbi:MAG: molybdopterin-dependent oxidoreductase, partial [Chloroflexi bacterium]|nr:molybdopterin-dependent oxidoreductase [Chloroflexota bacterium]
RSPSLQFCAQAAEVEVDPETGQVRVRRIAAVNDVGTIINEIGHQGQVEGSVVQGIGYALMEELATEQGRITTSSLGEYKLPTLEDIPDLVTINVQSTGPGPFNAMGIGETPIVPTAAAIANAVADAIGAPVTQLPILPERVLEARSTILPES